MDVSDNVSYVSAIKSVRKKLVVMQQQMATMGHLVMEWQPWDTW